MIVNPTIPALAQSRLLDAALEQVQTSLLAGLTWLNNAYGKAEKREREVNGSVIRYPAIYVRSKNEYLSMFPDSHLGNFCFFDVEDRHDIAGMQRQHKKITSRIGLIFWFDFRTIYPSDYETRTLENVKAEVIEFFRTAYFAANVSVIFSEVAERSENIYRGYTISEIDNQFMMRPFGAFRLNGEIRYYENC